MNMKIDMPFFILSGIMFWLSFPGCLFLVILSGLSCPGSLVLGVVILYENPLNSCQLEKFRLPPVDHVGQSFQTF
jgi:hypothetical protein